MSISVWSLLMLLACLMSVASAQDIETDTYASEDGTLSFDYPVGWLIDHEDHPSRIIVRNLPITSTSTQGIIFQISVPQKFYHIGYEYDIRPREMVERLIAREHKPPTPIDFVPPAESIPQPSTGEPLIVELTDENSVFAYTVVEVQSGSITLIGAVDLGHDYRMTIEGVRLTGGPYFDEEKDKAAKEKALGDVDHLQNVVKGIVSSLTFTSPERYSGNPDLPHVYSGRVDTITPYIKDQIEFFYPEGWYIYPSMWVSISNKKASGADLSGSAGAGEFIARFGEPLGQLAFDEQRETGEGCFTPEKIWTAQSLVNHLFTAYPEQVEVMKSLGLTRSDPETVIVNDREIIYFRLFNGDFEGMQIYMDAGENIILNLSVEGKRGEITQFEEKLFQMLTTARYTVKRPDVCVNAAPQIDATP